MNYMLKKDSVIAIIPGKRGVDVRCVKGSLWLTATSDIRDFVLSDGENIQMNGPGKIAVQAFCDTCLSLEGQKFNLVEFRGPIGELKPDIIKVRRA